MKMLIQLAALAAVLGITGCAAPVEPQGGLGHANDESAGNAPIPLDNNTAGGATIDDDEVYTSTVVNKKADGTIEVISTPITRKREIAENNYRAAQAAAQAAGITMQQTMSIYDSSCAGSSNWLYDQTGLVGNRICFSFAVLDCERDNLSLYNRGTIVCSGTTYTTKWAGGPYQCNPPYGADVALPNTNFVKSVWTGYPFTSGVSFYTSSGTYVTGYGGSNVQYTNVSPSGRDVNTCHS